MTGDDTVETGAGAPSNDSSAKANNDSGPRKISDTKRVLACGTCRKRKLKCDSKRPKCSTCARLGHPCEYDEVRKKSGPKRGYVKSLEARLNQLENLLDQNRDPPTETAPAVLSTDTFSSNGADTRNDSSSPNNTFHVGAPDLELGPAPAMHDHDVNLLSNMMMPESVDFSWDMISLGLEEPLPGQDVMDELYQLFFQKIHPSLPMMHRPRFMTSLKLGPNSRPPVCLRYMMWSLACSVSSKYAASAEQFYKKARKYIEKDEMQGHGEGFITVAHAQCWNLIACYEFKNMYFPRAWMSVGKATRLVQMLGLHRQDGLGLDVKQTLAPPKDWIDREERRRTFWIAFCQDRYASIGTGWPMTIDEQDILTNLPSSEEAFSTGSPESTSTLASVMRGEGISNISALTTIVLLATIFGRNLTHLHRPSDDDNDHDLGGDFWKRHRSLDNIILNMSLSMPGHLRLPQGMGDPKVIFSNMNIHTSTICLHQAAIFKADKHKLASQISSESKRRCLVAADQIANLMRMVSHQDLTTLNPFSAFCLYVAARVFVQYLKFKKDDHTVRSSLVFLLQAMQVLKEHNPLTESFLIQLDVDLEGSGIDIPMAGSTIQNRYNRTVPTEVPENFDAVKCIPLMEIRVSQDKPQPPQPSPNAGYYTMPARTDQHAPLFPPNNPMDAENISTLESNPCYSMRMFDNGAHGSAPTPPFSNDASPSHSQSNHPTPSSSSNLRGSSYSQRSPGQSEMQSFGGSGTTEMNMMFNETSMPRPKTVIAPGLVTRTFDMSPPADDQPGMPGSMQQSQQSSTMLDLDQFNIEGTGLTPGPTGLTPAAEGGSGMTPAFSMTPLNEWQNMGMDENTNWMFQ